MPLRAVGDADKAAEQQERGSREIFQDYGFFWQRLGVRGNRLESNDVANRTIAMNLLFRALVRVSLVDMLVVAKVILGHVAGFVLAIRSRSGPASLERKKNEQEYRDEPAHRRIISAVG